MTVRFTNHMKVWPFSKAPTEFQNLSNNGGDEDWIVYIPMELWDTMYCAPIWLEKIDSCMAPQQIRYKANGHDAMIFIGSHA